MSGARNYRPICVLITTCRKVSLELAGIILSALIAISAVGLWTLKASSSADNKSRETEIFQTTYNFINDMEKMVAAGDIDEAKAK